MCGIFGYYNWRVRKSRKEIVECLLTGLRRLEYRGYDSAGIAIDAQPCDATSGSNGGSHGPAAAPPLVLKSSGKIAELEKHVALQLGSCGADGSVEFDIHAGIAHTRWATHGRPSAVNAHPQTSGPACEFVVIHNGIITNHRALKEFLASHGATFESETDTEVIPKPCKWLYDSLPEPVSLSQLVMTVMAQIEGACALLVKSTHYPGELVACKRGAPLILGVRKPAAAAACDTGAGVDGADGDREGGHTAKRRPGIELFLASDASAVVEHTKRVLHLEEGDVVALRRGAFEVFNAAERFEGGPPAPAKARALQTLNMEVAQIMKGGFQHFMQKEIFEQPETLLQTMRGRVQFRPEDAAAASAAAAHPALSTPRAKAAHSPLSPPPGAAAPCDPYLEQRIKLGGLAEHLGSIRRGRRLVFVACGTSYNACLAARSTVEDLVGLPVALELASDMLDRRAPVFRDDTCVFVSQSGETADTLRALEYSKEAGALCVGITNTVGSAISRGTHCGVHINAGAEIGVASTKAYTSQITVITMMALALSADSISKHAQRDAIIDGMGRLPAAVRAALDLDDAIRQLAEQLKEEQSLLVFGRGFNYATALEGALKIKEVALMHSEGILAGEMKHGPLALVDETLPILVVATQDTQHAKMLSVIHQLCARHARLVVLCCEGDSDIEGACGAGGAAAIVRVPRVPDCLQPVVNIVPLQLLAYHLTLLRGHDVDQPRNLAKSVTVTEEDAPDGAAGGALLQGLGGAAS